MLRCVFGTGGDNVGVLLMCNGYDVDNDPRTVDNLLDGVNHTCDDLHAWLAPFTGGQSHLIHVEFDEVSKTSLLII